MPRKLWVFAACAVLSAALFVRLGVWQLHRLAQRRARNAEVRVRMAEPAVSYAALPNDSGRVAYRSVTVTGTPDYSHELILAMRTRQGAPGVDLLTPVRVAGRDSAVLVNRGWVYSADGQSIDEARWRESDTAFAGFVEVMPRKGRGGSSSSPRLLRQLELDAVARAVPYPVSPTYVVDRDTSNFPGAGGGARTGRPVRLDLPALDDGPHLSYAIQWFSFAAIALGGTGFVLYQAWRARGGGNPRAG